jgi:hypothetical protein
LLRVGGPKKQRERRVPQQGRCDQRPSMRHASKEPRTMG